jgi:hypothetical protein
LRNLEEGSSTGDFESWMRGSGDGASFSQEAPWMGPQGAPSLGTLQDMLGRSPDTDISLNGFPFPHGGNLVCAGEARILGALIDE